MLDTGFDDRIAGITTRLYATGPDTGAPTLVMVHGGDPRSLANATDFSTVWDRGARVAPRLLAYDRPGQGFTLDPRHLDHGTDPAGLVEHLAEVLDRHTSGPVVLLGHSRGALPVLACALDRPGGVAGVVVVASNTLAPDLGVTPRDFYPRAYADPPPEPEEEWVTREARWNSAVQSHLGGDAVDARMAIARSPGWWSSHVERRKRHDEVLKPRLEQARDELLARLADARRALPVLTVWGTDDVSAPEALGRALHERLTAAFVPADYVALSGAAHYVYRDRADTFAGVLASWLATEVGWGTGGATASPPREEERR